MVAFVDGIHVAGFRKTDFLVREAKYTQRRIIGKGMPRHNR